MQLASPGPVARGAAMRSYLQGRGVIGCAWWLLAPTQGDAVTLRVVPGPVAIDKLDDKNLPPPTQRVPWQPRRSGQAVAVIDAFRPPRAAA